MSDHLSDIGSYSVLPSPSPLHSQVSPRTGSYPWNSSAAAATTWSLESSGTAGYFNIQRDSTSPRAQGSDDQAQRISGHPRTQASDARLPLLTSTRPTFAYSVTDNPSEPGHAVHTSAARLERSSSNTQRVETSLRQSWIDVEADSSRAILTPTQVNLLQPLTGQSTIMQSQSPSTNPSESPSPTQSVASDPGGSKAQSTTGKRKKPRRKAHNAIERRYRSKLNEKIAGLRDSIPSLRTKIESVATRPGSSTSPAGSSSASSKVNKADILEKATEYIKYLEISKRQLEAQLQEALAFIRDDSMKGSPPLAYSTTGQPPGLRPPVQSEHHSDDWYLQSSDISVPSYEQVQFEPSKPGNAGSVVAGQLPERQIPLSDNGFDAYRRSS